MHRRDSELKSHEFKDSFVKMCEIHDLQGLLIGNDNNFTAAIEAFTIKNKEKITSVRESVFPLKETYSKAAFAEQLKIPFYIFLHREGTNKIKRYSLQNDILDKTTKCIEKVVLNEEEFISWWKSNKVTIQTKPYRKEFKKRVLDNYYDKLLEKNNLKWGGNIDGFLSIIDENEKVLAIIENRFTNICSIKKYDPNNYFKDKKDPLKNDYNNWLPLFMIKSILDIPIFLCTYSNRNNETKQLGIAEVVSFDYNGIYYKNNLKPYNNIFNNLQNAKEWMFKEINNYGK